MSTELEPQELDCDLPRVRPLRLILGGLFAFAGVLGTVWSLLAVCPADPPREPQGAAAALGQHYVSVIAWVALVVCAIVGLLGTVTLVTALLEARAAGRARPSGTP